MRVPRSKMTWAMTRIRMLLVKSALRQSSLSQESQSQIKVWFNVRWLNCKRMGQGWSNLKCSPHELSKILLMSSNRTRDQKRRWTLIVIYPIIMSKIWSILSLGCFMKIKASPPSRRQFPKKNTQTYHVKRHQSSKFQECHQKQVKMKMTLPFWPMYWRPSR